MRERSWWRYNRALVNRGSLTILLATELERVRRAGASRAEAVEGRGRPWVHGEGLIGAALVLQSVYRLPLRQTQGLLESVIRLRGLDLPTPDYSTLSRRRTTVRLPAWPAGGSVLAIDSTGLQIGGPGSWFTTVRGHRHRSWRKVHLGVNPRTGELVAGLVAGLDLADAGALPCLLTQVRPRAGASIVADGAYDRRSCYAEARRRGLWLVAPPNRRARLHHDPAWRDRDFEVARVRLIGRDAWKQETGYHRRSLAESTMWRLKSAFGSGLRSRAAANQDHEALLRLHLLNRWPTPNAIALRVSA